MSRLIRFLILSCLTLTTHGRPLFSDRYYRQYAPVGPFIKNDRCTSLIKTLLYRESADSFYDQHHHKQSLDQLIFGKDLSIGDIYLQSKLSGDGKLTLPGGGNNFGNAPNQQYVNCLSGAKLNISASKKEVHALLRAMRYFYLSDCCRVKGAAGILIPFRQVNHSLCIDFEDASIACGVNPDFLGNLGQTNISQFFSDFIDVNDFFNRGILAPKGLELKKRQTKAGISDIQFVALFDITPFIRAAEDFGLGVYLTAPTGSKLSGNIIWEPELGNGGAWQIEPFLSAHFETCAAYLNPFIYSSVIYSFPFHATRRVGQLKTSSNQLKKLDRFADFVIAPFSEYDVTVREFADQAVPVRIERGTAMRFILGNYWKNIFDTQCTIGFYYDLQFEDSSSVRAREKGASYNISILEEYTSKLRHELAWNASLYYNEQVRIFVGSKHVVGGKNVCATHTIFGNAILYF